MKRIIRILSLILTLAMLFSISVFAADTSKNGVYTVESKGATATFEIETDSNNKEHEKIKVTYKNETAIVETGYYLILMVTGDGSAASITDTNIKYIDQVSGNSSGEIVFWVYPETLTSGTILITGTNITASDIDQDTKAVGLIAAIVSGKLVGDVNEDGFVDATDALWILQYRTNTPGVSLTENGKIHADVNLDGFIDATDALLILQYRTGVVSKLPYTPNA